ncbi:phosphoribosylpyrophosphate synthetase [Maribacter sp. PR1]|uniref:Phosphoribosylpyrophosphate synthetase n=1 Tax=Maribacter cobaltidurans TaxID=1178778 RepID=A0ABU7ITN6_9FLAO|nr:MULTISPECIES: phosphoribosylpyrophosphate synthetase [Maribacter]MDC6388957.1 phosphoribosylpyrophosphate synthetase [Maribacter sp. PR1]MEE1976345.1 phosphoribosylpyrophosphate synthetase [Maribacter cobaltidurans]|tara:strand:- start:525 stop:818 length:294 start_codon:yes stop_codon:yes gene_type:complete
MKSYDTLSEAVQDLQRRGYTYDFNLKPHCLECASLKLEIHPEDFKVDEVHRFEGMSSTDDNSIMYAISSKNGIKGTLVDAYGVYAENISEEMRKKLI